MRLTFHRVLIMTDQVPSICDFECQKKKRIAGLKIAYETEKDPEKKEEARRRYFTALNGQSWVANDNTNDVASCVSDFKHRYNNLKKESTIQSRIMSMFSSLSQTNDDSTLVDEIDDKTSVLQRLNQLSTGPAPVSNFLPMLFDGILVILGIVVIYLIFAKFENIKKLFGYSQPVEILESLTE